MPPGRAGRRTALAANAYLAGSGARTRRAGACRGGRRSAAPAPAGGRLGADAARRSSRDDGTGTPARRRRGCVCLRGSSILLDTSRYCTLRLGPQTGSAACGCWTCHKSSAASQREVVRAASGEKGMQLAVPAACGCSACRRAQAHDTAARPILGASSRPSAAPDATLGAHIRCAALPYVPLSNPLRPMRAPAARTLRLLS